MTQAVLSAAVLVLTLGLFAWGRLRHDLVAVLALAACLVLGLVAPSDALGGFSDPAVVVVAAVLIIGRAVEMTGVAAAATERLAALRAPFPLQLSILLLAGAALSAFMNNIAALAITMPAVAGICRSARLPAAAGLMPLAFATILGGMTTLIGTPANLILSSVREDLLGAPFDFFAMTPVGAAAAGAGLLYLCLLGWRLTPTRRGRQASVGARSVFEVRPPADASPTPPALYAALRKARGYVLGVVRRRRWLPPHLIDGFRPGDRLLVLSRDEPQVVARKAGCRLVAPASKAIDAVSVRVVVAHGSPLVGRHYETVAAETDGDVRVVAGGPRAARARSPLAAMVIEPGDQLVLAGAASRVEPFARYARLLEVERKAAVKVSARQSALVLAVYAAAVLGAAVFRLPTALTFAGAAAALAALRFLPQREVYSSVDWPAIVLLAAMIPVGQSFVTTGAAALVAEQVGQLLVGASLFVAAAAVATLTLLLSIFLNNVATAVIVGPIAVSVAHTLGLPPDALLLAVLIGASSDFLTPIGHQNNLLVMGPGGYRFSDYARVGALLSLVVVLVAAGVIAASFG